MSREIKFRAWDQYRRIMFNNVGTSPLQNGKTTTYIQNYDLDIDLDTLFGGEHPYDGDEYENLYADHLDLMQYTGLKDKKGKEIYEGDIIRLIKKVDRRLVTEPVEIRWYGVGFTGVWNMAHRHFDDALEEREVIGNIYENPELLGGDNEPTG